MLDRTSLVIDQDPAWGYGALPLLATTLVHIAGNIAPTRHGTLVAESAAHAVVEHSTATVLVNDGPGVSGAALEAISASSPDRLIVVARRGVTTWHRDLAQAGALVVEGRSSRLLAALADATLLVEQATPERPPGHRVACVPGPILTAATAGSNQLLLDATIEIVPDLTAWARRLAYLPTGSHGISALP